MAGQSQDRGARTSGVAHGPVGLLGNPARCAMLGTGPDDLLARFLQILTGITRIVI